MRKVVRITESELKNAIKNVLEQSSQNYNYRQDTNNNPTDFLGSKGSLGIQQKRNLEANLNQYQIGTLYQCVPKEMRYFVLFAIDNKDNMMKKLGVDEKTYVFLIKLAIGIMGRETTFGKSTEMMDDATEWMTKFGYGLEAVPYLFKEALNKLRKLRGLPPITQSLGVAQFTPETWKKYNLNNLVGPFHKNWNAVGSGIGTMFRLITDYRTALKNGAGIGPSENPIAMRQGKIKAINGTGNNAWDLSIVAHNMGPKLLTAWCQTNDPNYAAPCSSNTYQPFPDTNKSLVLKVDKSKKLQNYFPNKKSGDLTSIGYLEEVAGYIKNYGCVSL